MGQQPLGIVLKGRGNGFRLEAALNAFQQLQVVTDYHIGPLRQQQLHAVDLGATGADLDVETIFFVQPSGLSLIITPLLRLSVPGGQQNDFLLGLNGQRDTAESHQAQPAKAPGKACTTFHYPSPLHAGRGASKPRLSLPSRSTLNRDMVTEQCPVWITRTDRFYSHSAIQKQCQI